MRFTSLTTSIGVSERLFTLGDVTGVLWSPDGATAQRPLVLLGHGGGQHKRSPGMVARAHRYVTTHGFAAAAIDAPAHGDRPRTERDERLSADLRERLAAAQPIGPRIARYNAEVAAHAVPEWQATLDALQELDYIGTGGPVGFWGVSLGGAIGVLLAAAEPRITAAVFGLVGHDTLADAAAGVTVPVEFLLQWDDEIVSRASALALFDTFASQEKTLHANSGRHQAVPAFEMDSSERFFTRHLVERGAHATTAPGTAAERQSPRPADQHRRVMPTYSGFDGAQLHYDDLYRGDNRDHGLPLITLAGGAARDPSYLGDLAGLDTEHRLIVPHLRGVGRSPLPDSAAAASYWRQAEDVECLRAHLGLGQVNLLGHSAGTRLAISYAAQFPERISSLVLITPPAGYLADDVPSDTEEIISKRRGEPAFDAALAAWPAGPEAHDDDAFNAWWSRVAPLGYATWTAAEQAHAAIGRTSFAANRAFFSVDPPHDLAERLANVAAPVLIVAGAQDCSAGVAAVIALARLFPAGEAVTIERCGHYPWVEQPTAFRHKVDQFLSALPHLRR